MLLEIKVTEDLIAASQGVSLGSCLCEFLLLYLSSQDLHLHRKFHKLSNFVLASPWLGSSLLLCGRCRCSHKTKDLCRQKGKEGKKGKPVLVLPCGLWQMSHQPRWAWLSTSSEVMWRACLSASHRCRGKRGDPAQNHWQLGKLIKCILSLLISRPASSALSSSFMPCSPPLLQREWPSHYLML